MRGPLAALSLSMMLSALGTSIANVGLPALAQAFGASFQEVQWVVLAYLLAITTLIVGVGGLGDMLGRRRLLLVGIALFTLASLACGLASSLLFLIAARCAQGLGAAMMMALTMAFVGDSVPREKSGSAMGLLGTMSAVGTALGPSLGGILIAGFGWQAIFMVNLPLGIFAFALAWRFLPADAAPGAARRDFDVLGMVLLSLTLATYALAMTVRCSVEGSCVTLLLATATGAALFLLAEAKAASPLVDLAMFRDARFNSGLATSALVSMVMMATLVIGPFYLARGLGLGAAMVGLVMSIGPAVSAFSGLVAGRMVDRWGAPAMVMAGLGGVTAGALGLSVLPPLLGLAGYILAMVMLTPGYQLFLAANNTGVMTAASGGRRGVVSGLLNLSRNLGLVTGASLMGAIFAAASGVADVAAAAPAGVALGTRTAFAAAALAMMGAIVIAARARRGGGQA